MKIEKVQTTQEKPYTIDVGNLDCGHILYPASKLYSSHKMTVKKITRMYKASRSRWTVGLSQANR